MTRTTITLAAVGALTTLSACSSTDGRTGTAAGLSVIVSAADSDVASDVSRGARLGLGYEPPTATSTDDVVPGGMGAFHHDDPAAP